MQFLVVLASLVAVAVGRPGLITPIQHQYHAQDELGQYTYGYSGGPSAKVESRTADGITRGAYSYIDSNGLVQNVNYEADPVNGFRVAATNLPVAPAAPVAAVAPVAVAPAVPVAVAPVPVVDTPEVAIAKAQHLAVKAAADAQAVIASGPVVVGVAPVPVAETPEVAAEKARHLAAVAVARSTIVDDSAVADDGSYKPSPIEDDGEYKGEPVQVAVVPSPVGPVAAVVSDDDSHLHDDGSYKVHPLEEDGSYKLNPYEDDGSYKGEVVVVGNSAINTLLPAKVHQAYLAQPYAYAAPAVARYAYAAPAVQTVAYSAVAPATHSQYHAQDELGQYTYGYAGGLSAKHETKSADGVTRGGYSYIDANGIVQSVQYVSDSVNGFRVAATNLPVAPSQ